MNGQPPAHAPSAGRAVLAALGALLCASGGATLAYAIVVLVTRPLLFIVAVPFAIFGLLLAGLGVLLLLPWWRRRRARPRPASA